MTTATFGWLWLIIASSSIFFILKYAKKQEK